MKIGKLKEILSHYDDNKEICFAYADEGVGFGDPDVAVIEDENGNLEIMEDCWWETEGLIYHVKRDGVPVDKFNVERND